MDGLGATPIDLALGISDRVGKGGSDLAKLMEDEDFFSNKELASTFLHNIKNYSYLHQG